MMANSSRSRRYGSAGASVLLAASLSLCAGSEYPESG